MIEQRETEIVVRNPYDGREVGRVPALSEPEVRAALDRAAGHRDVLQRHERSGVLTAIARQIAEAGDTLARLISCESGLCLKDTRHELGRAQDVFLAAAGESLRDDGAIFAADTSPRGRARRAFTSREPIGLVAAITPFNHPLNQVAHKIAPAIAVGTPIVVKSSERTPLAAQWLADAVARAGLPEPACIVVTGDARTIVDAMLAHEAVELVSFTGSVQVGRMLAGRLGYRRAALELGGNDPLIVLRDADLELAARLVVSGAFENSGQRCTAIKRVICESGVLGELAERTAALAGTLVAGDPLDGETDVGTVIDQAAAETIERRIHDALRDGARLLVGGRREGALITPAVLDRVQPEMELVCEETFGPIAPFLEVRDLDEAIALANGTRFGLSAGVVTNRLDAAIRCGRELRCGTVNINEVPGFRSELAPFGGVKDSGIGVKEGVLEAMRSMTTQKLLSLAWG